MKTALLFPRWSEARARGINILEVDPRLKGVARRFSGLEKFVSTADEDTLQAMEVAVRVADNRPFDLSEARNSPPAFAVYSGQTAILESLVFATSQSDGGAPLLTEGVLFPLLQNRENRGHACVAIHLQVKEVPKRKEMNESAEKGDSADKKEPSRMVIAARVDIQPLDRLMKLSRLFSFRNDRSQQWARKTFETGLRALKRVATFTEPVLINVPDDVNRKLVALALYPEFSANPPVTLASLEARFKEFGLSVRQNNVRDLFKRMEICEAQ